MKNNKAELLNKLKSQPISIGILASNWLEFKNTLEIISQQNLNLLHFDIADNQFSPMFTVGPMAIKQFPEQFIKDVHLMVKEQFKIAKDCVKFGANIISLQIETNENLIEIYNWLNQKEIICGISICPETNLNEIDKYLEYIDLIQVLTLDPRTGFKKSTEFIKNRITCLQTKLKERNLSKLISVDGSMNFELAQDLNKLNINWVVSGSAIFNQNVISDTIKQWKQALS